MHTLHVGATVDHHTQSLLELVLWELPTDRYIQTYQWFREQVLPSTFSID